MENLDEEIESKKQKFKALKERLTANAADLSACRQKVIEKFIDSVKRELKDLSFQSVLFDVKNELNIDYGSTFNITVDGAKVKPRINGIDNIEFLISLNTGESAKPLSKIVSGGEVSRVMLSLKSILSGIDNISTMVFDEIDTGIGGSTSIVVGRKLYGISRRCQVICITHLAQIAAFADSHYFIDKVIQSGRTKINISLLSHEKSRVKEIARMLSGMTENEISIRHAVELLNEINKIRNGLNYETGEELKIGN
jgi:DNA repair protein RecN (Recombination protein N)